MVEIVGYLGFLGFYFYVFVVFFIYRGVDRRFFFFRGGFVEIVGLERLMLGIGRFVF